jgi:hypothetical protein
VNDLRPLQSLSNYFNYSAASITNKSNYEQVSDSILTEVAWNTRIDGEDEFAAEPLLPDEST